MPRKFNFFDWASGRSSARLRRGKQPRRRKREVLAAALVASLLGVFIVWKAFWGRGAHEDHPHELGPHGGGVVAMAEDEPHSHAEVVVERGGVMKLYTFGAETDEALEVESQPLITEVTAAGDKEPTSVILRPAPQPEDAEGKTSRFSGRLPTDLVGRRLDVTVPRIVIGHQGFRFGFGIPGEGHGPGAAARAIEEERSVVLNPGGGYTEADIRANGRMTASERFRGVRVVHDAAPKAGDRLCPVTRIKADPRFSWVIGGRTYQFCCPPCITEFVRLAKERPEGIEGPDEFVKE